MAYNQLRTTGLFEYQNWDPLLYIVKIGTKFFGE